MTRSVIYRGQVLGWHLLHHWGLVSKLGLRRRALGKFLGQLEAAYGEADYHCATHAADVLQVRVWHALGGLDAYRHDPAFMSQTRLQVHVMGLLIHIR